MAAPSKHTTTKMVLNGQWTGRHERIRSGHVNTEHAYPHVRILSQSVSGNFFLESKTFSSHWSHDETRLIKIVYSVEKYHHLYQRLSTLGISYLFSSFIHYKYDLKPLPRL